MTLCVVLGFVGWALVGYIVYLWWNHGRPNPWV